MRKDPFDVQTVKTSTTRLELSPHAERLFHYWTQLSARSVTENGADEWLGLCGRQAIMVLKTPTADPVQVVVGGFEAYEALSRLRAYDLAPTHLILRKVTLSDAEQVDQIDLEFATLLRQLLPRPKSMALKPLVGLISEKRQKALFGRTRPTLRNLEKLNGFSRARLTKPKQTIFESITHGQ
jgi:hypothetical protein